MDKHDLIMTFAAKSLAAFDDSLRENSVRPKVK